MEPSKNYAWKILGRRVSETHIRPFEFGCVKIERDADEDIDSEQDYGQIRIDVYRARLVESKSGPLPAKEPDILQKSIPAKVKKKLFLFSFLFLFFSFFFITDP